MSSNDPNQVLPHQLTNAAGEPTRDRPWLMRTYAGHTSAKASNELFRENLARGQMGLSIAFDLPTQCGYSSEHPLAAPEVGRVGVPINSLDDFHLLFKDIPLTQMNTSMTINGTALWLFALYIALAKERGDDIAQLRGTTQNDIVKEYLARGTYVFPPDAHFRIIAEMYEYALEHVPRWNAANICSYHLQEAGATPAQEIAFAFANAIGILDLLKERGHFTHEQFEQVVGRISFFVNAGIRFIEEMCKMRAFTEMWDDITANRYGVTNPKYRRFRYGVQVNSLGLTAQQPENNAWRILLETLAVTLSRNARCRALQLPAWNEALSLPRPWDQQWSLRLQQILAHETDILEYPDLFEGNPAIESKVASIKADAQAELDRILDAGGVGSALSSGLMKTELVRSMAERIARINNGEQIVVGMNKWEDGLPSPLLQGEDGGLFQLGEDTAAATLDTLQATKVKRDETRVTQALAALKQAAHDGTSMIEPSVECALARVTTGEWADALRDVFGDYRPPTGIEGQQLPLNDPRIAQLQQRIEAIVQRTGHRPRMVLGKPGLDGHSNGAEMIALATSHIGMEVIYSGIRLTPAQIVHSAIEESADMIGISVLSGAHLALAQQIMDLLASEQATDIPVIFGGIIPETDHDTLRQKGIRDIFTPHDTDLATLLERLVFILEETSGSDT
jgi:(2R)-ethylmalonyl-CoA mutase